MADSTVEKEPVSEKNIKKYVNLLSKRFHTNQNDRIEHPDDPEKWVKSEVDLDEYIRIFRDLSTIPSLYPEFLKLGGFKTLSEILSHPNIDIVISCITVLSDLLDPEIIYNLENPEDFLKELESLSLDKLCVAGLLRIEEDNGEIDYNGVKSSFELVENLIEIVPNVLNDMASNVDLLSFLLKRMKTRKTMAYDSNRIHASEILCILLQGSEESLVKLGSRDPLDGLDVLLRIIAIYRKRDPDSIEEEELVENVFQCLCRLMFKYFLIFTTTFSKENQLRFGNIQGIQLMIRLIRERRQTYRPALKLLDYSLLDCPENCELFVKLFGLKCIFSVLMRKGVSSKPGSEEEKQEDENLIGVINSLCTYCKVEELLRVANKFVEHKYEKLERVVDLHHKYMQRANSLLKKIDQNKNSSKEIFEMLSLNEGEQSYLDKYEAGLSICQLIDCIIIRVYNMENTNLSLCLLVLLKKKEVDIQDIYNNISGKCESGHVFLDFLDHLSDEAKETKEQVELLLKNFLIGAKESQMFN